ncbi:hypothetical protein FH597_13985 [Leptospira interrogans]|uniref:hypothetical protein n=1 Tax=Leptospira interrogans TaxID=173 RepID=UPI001EF075CD|nr:hypothetical protein [Leptospira interrogans]ULG76285.1 hypothetical protein FH597_13985 [Leptospira interrogans]
MKLGGFLNLPDIHSCKQYTLVYDNQWKEYFGNKFIQEVSLNDKILCLNMLQCILIDLCRILRFMIV